MRPLGKHQVVRQFHAQRMGAGDRERSRRPLTRGWPALGQKLDDVGDRQPVAAAGKRPPAARERHRLDHHAHHVRVGEEVLEDRGRTGLR